MYASVAEQIRKMHEPGLGRPYAIFEPHVRPDGGRVVVTGAVVDELAGVERTALYTAEGGGLRAVTSGPGSARWGRFSPDGRTLAFLSDRGGDEGFQLYLLDDRRWGEAAAAPAVPGTVEYAHWSPDGTMLLLGVAGLGAELSSGQGSGRNVTLRDDLPSWYPRIEEGVSQAEWRSLWVYAVGTGELSRLSPKGLNCWEAAWCGLGQVAAVTSDAPQEDAWYTSVLTLIDVRRGTSRELLRSDRQLGWPAGSSDGRHVGVVEAVCSDRCVVAGDVTVIDLATGETRAVDTHGTDVTWLQWIDGRRLGYLGLRHLDSVAGVVDLHDRTVTELSCTDRACGGQFYPDGAFTADGRIVVVRSAYDLPPRLVLIEDGNDELLASTAHPGSDHLLTVAGTAEVVHWSGPDGLPIEGIVCAPHGAGPFPLVVNIHGGPIWAFRNTWLMGSMIVPTLVSRGYAVLNPNPRGSSGRGQEFVRHVAGDMGGADTDDILSGIDALIERGVADRTRIGLIGKSYGGFMTSWLVTQDQRFAAAVLVAPVTDWYSQTFTSNVAAWGRSFLAADPEVPGTRMHARSPVLHASRVRTPCLSIAGANDRATPPGQAQEFHQALLANGVRSVLAVYPEEGHGIRAYPATVDFVTRVTCWFEEHMPPGGS